MPNFLARSRAPFTRFGASLMVRIPWSVKFIDTINVGIRFSLDVVVCLRAAIMRRGFCSDKTGRCGLRGHCLRDLSAGPATADEKEMTPDGGTAGVNLGWTQGLGGNVASSFID